MNVEQDFHYILEQALDQQIVSGCPGVILDVRVPRVGLAFAGARGLFARNELRPLQVHDPFRAASVTKMVTATLAVALAAEHRWNLDDAIITYLPPRIVSLLHKVNGLQMVRDLTLRRLLRHTSGLPDYFFAEPFQATVKSDPTRLWHPKELLEEALKGAEMLFPPGTDFAYGDTAYVLVGLAIEQLLECSLAEAYRTMIFHPLEMEATYLEWHEPARGSFLAHHYEGEQDVLGRNLSFDWAGGGLVTTASDLTRFLSGVFGQVLFSRRWLAELTDWILPTRWRPHSSARYLRYGLGMGTNLAYGEELIGATGVWGAFAYYWPRGEATMAGTVNLVGADRPALLDEIIRAIKRSRLFTSLDTEKNRTSLC